MRFATHATLAFFAGVRAAASRARQPDRRAARRDSHHRRHFAAGAGPQRRRPRRAGVVGGHRLPRGRHRALQREDEAGAADQPGRHQLRDAALQRHAPAQGRSFSRSSTRKSERTTALICLVDTQQSVVASLVPIARFCFSLSRMQHILRHS
jgi:hypothetical protein